MLPSWTQGTTPPRCPILVGSSIPRSRTRCSKLMAVLSLVVVIAVIARGPELRQPRGGPELLASVVERRENLPADHGQAVHEVLRELQAVPGGVLLPPVGRFHGEHRDVTGRTRLQPAEIGAREYRGRPSCRAVQHVVERHTQSEE